MDRPADREDGYGNEEVSLYCHYPESGEFENAKSQYPGISDPQRQFDRAIFIISSPILRRPAFVVTQEGMDIMDTDKLKFSQKSFCLLNNSILMGLK